MNSINRKPNAFTIVELLIVIVIIGILATIVIVAYNGITRKAQDATLQSDLKNASTTLEIANATDGTYPSDASSLKHGSDTVFNYKYTSSDNSYCLQASSAKTTNIYSVTNGNTMVNGTCPLVMQTVTTANCPITRTRAYDARDNHSYWIQKLADGKCWMLTNLAYGGGGTNTYSDVIPTGDGSTGTLNGPDNAGSTNYTLAKYYIPTGANPTTEPTNPSTSIDGGATNPQYGYLYNWCAAMGSQATAACANATTPAPVTTTSICPKNWRLSTSNFGGESFSLTSAINATNNSAGSTNLRSTWLAQYGGWWVSSFGWQGTNGYFWSSTQNSSTAAFYIQFSSSIVNPANATNLKSYGLSVRCLAAV